MEERIKKAYDRWNESWFIFSMTGNIEDCRMFLEDLAEYDMLLAQEEYQEME